MAEIRRLEAAIRSEVDAVVTAQRVRLAACDLDYSVVGQTMVNTAVLEITRNMVKYAGSGWLRVTQVGNTDRPGLCIVAEDRGPGIADVRLALEDGYSTGESLGLGLPGARRLMDSFEIRSAVGQGTWVRMVKWRT